MSSEHLLLHDKLEIMEGFRKLLDSSIVQTADIQRSFPDAAVNDIDFFGYWCLLIGFFCMALSTLYFYGAAVNVRGNKFFEVMTMSITGIGALAYLTMFTGAGRVFIEQVPGTLTPVYWARYVDWLLTTPLMIAEVLALAGASLEEIMFCIVLDAIMIASGMVGAQTHNHMKWVFFLVGCACFLTIVKKLVEKSGVKKFGTEAHLLYNKCTWMMIILWTLYPVVWLACDGLRISSPNLEACMYMVMDVTAKCLFGFFIVHSRGALESINSNLVNLKFF